MKSAIVMLGGLVLATNACAGNVKMSYLTEERLRSGREVKGVIVYRPMIAKLTHTFTMLVKDGKVLKDSCQRVIQKEELVMVADSKQPMRIRNASGMFSAAKFSVTISNGVLTAVNAEPTQKLSDVLTAASSLVKEAVDISKSGSGWPACNASPVIVLTELEKQS